MPSASVPQHAIVAASPPCLFSTRIVTSGASSSSAAFTIAHPTSAMRAQATTKDRAETSTYTPLRPLASPRRTRPQSVLAGLRTQEEGFSEGDTDGPPESSDEVLREPMEEGADLFSPRLDGFLRAAVAFILRFCGTLPFYRSGQGRRLALADDSGAPDALFYAIAH